MSILDLLSGAVLLAVMVLGIPKLLQANGHRRFVLGNLIIATIVICAWLNYIGPGWQQIRPVFYIGIGGTMLWVLRIPPFHRT